MAQKYRFYDRTKNVLADMVELPFSLGGFEAGKEYPTGTIFYTRIDEKGNEGELIDAGAFKMTGGDTSAYEFDVTVEPGIKDVKVKATAKDKK